MSYKMINEEEPKAKELALRILGSEAESHGIWRFIRYKLEDEPKYINQLGLFAIASHGDVIVRDSYVCASGYTITEKYWEFPINHQRNSYYTFNTQHFPLVNLHRIVAHTFLSDWDSTLVVNHIDGVKTNNNVDNLEMCTTADNVAHFRNASCFADIRKQHDVNCVKHLIGIPRSDEVKRKLSEANKGKHKTEESKKAHSQFMKNYYKTNKNPASVGVRCIETNEHFDTILDCCNRFGVSFITLTSHIDNPDKPSRKLAGYHFEYTGKRQSKQSTDKLSASHTGRIWMSNLSTHDRRLISASELDKYIALGYTKGKIK